MQVFIIGTPLETAIALDPLRLNKQIVECQQILDALNGDIENDFVVVCGLDDSRWNASKEVIGNIHDNPELLKGGAE
ncbi:MAG: hypothetical protein IKV17_07700 [Bacteroidaceae bacterium]|nr:hypothetical protein [Bacteroidaceae bacterium]